MPTKKQRVNNCLKNSYVIALRKRNNQKSFSESDVGAATTTSIVFV